MALQEVTAPMRYNLRRSKERLTEALSRLEELKQQLPTLQAKDLHYLSKCHEVQSMTLCAEMTHRAALIRTESRGWHFREDFPASDNGNWLKWVILREENGQIATSTQSIPIDEYRIRPNA
jgi:succinate dehydrogenase / fumarate reductase, flavoprotein subunit